MTANGIPIIVDGQRVGELEPMEYRGAREVAPIYTIHPDEIVATQLLSMTTPTRFYWEVRWSNPPNYKDRWELIMNEEL